MITESPEETIELGRQLGASLKGGELIILHGELGAGKTQFVRGIAAGLDSADAVSSPTFVIERIYHGRLTMLHIDLYRIAGAIDDLGIDEALREGCVVVVEWGDKLPESYDRRAKKIAIDFVEGRENAREILGTRASRPLGGRS